MLNFKLEMISQKLNKQNELFQLLLNTSKPIIIFGAGAEGKSKLSTLKKNDVPVLCFADNNPSKIGTFVNELVVIGFGELIFKYPDAYIIIGTWIYADEIVRQFKQAEYNMENLIQREIRSSDVDVMETVRENFKLFSSAYHLLEDELSRQVFINKLSYWNTLDDVFLRTIKSEHQMYFDKDLITLTNSEFFIDGGGYTGDTYEEFQSLVKDYKKYWFFEPDTHNYKIAEQKYKAHKKLELINKGLWGRTLTLSFDSSGDGSSRLSEKGSDVIRVTSIDEFINHTPVTFIKMDIEGAEKQALIGAKSIIAHNKPKLAVCVYHNFMDMIELPLLINKINPEYKLYLRHYSAGAVDTVCYAV